jgi:LDH2 family malate/lactate/ureidoglycolate dehydrogenase
MHIVPAALHNDLVRAAYRQRGFTPDEADDAARFCELAATHGIRTHNAIKALHLDDHFGSKAGGCVPGATIRDLTPPGKFAASRIWDAGRKLGQSTAFAAIDEAMRLADTHGIGQVSVDNAFHYLWGGGYVMEAARRGYIAYTNCTAALAEVVPFKGVFPTLGTNPHSWGFPTTEAVGYPIVIDWATSTVAMGRVQQFKREGKPLPPDAAVDAAGQPTTDPHSSRSAPTRDTAFPLSMKSWPRLLAAACPPCAAAPCRRAKSAPAPSTSRSFIPMPSTPALSPADAIRPPM